MFLQTTDDRVRRLEKRLGALEKTVNTTFSGLQDTLVTLSDVVARLPSTPDVALAQQRIALTQDRIEHGISDTDRFVELKETVITPVKTTVTSNFSFFQDVAREGIAVRPSTQALLQIVAQHGEISLPAAAMELKVHPLQVEHWALALKEQKQIGIIEKRNKKYLCMIKTAQR